MKQEETSAHAGTQQYGGQSSCQALAQEIGVTPSPRLVRDARAQGMTELLTDSSNQGPSSSAVGKIIMGTQVTSGLHDPDSLQSRKRMDLPRGRFRALKKNTCLLILLPELHTTAFTGYCRINLGSTPTVLVFDAGRIILAEFDSLGGDVALDRICMHIYRQVDVLLNDLNEGQIRLALEFNPSWIVSMEQSLSCFPGHEYFSVPAVEPEEASINRKTEPAGTIIDHEEYPDISVLVDTVQETDRDQSPVISESHSVPESSEIPDWKKALEMPVVGARETALSKETIVERPEPESGDEPGWKKALRMPVLAAIPVSGESLSDDNRTAVTGVPSNGNEIREQGRTFALLSPDSGLLEDKRVKKKVAAVKYPEPAEYWKLMSVNRGPNTSV